MVVGDIGINRILVNQVFNLKGKLQKRTKGKFKIEPHLSKFFRSRFCGPDWNIRSISKPGREIGSNRRALDRIQRTVDHGSPTDIEHELDWSDNCEYHHQWSKWQCESEFIWFKTILTVLGWVGHKPTGKTVPRV